MHTSAHFSFAHTFIYARKRRDTLILIFEPTTYSGYTYKLLFPLAKSEVITPLNLELYISLIPFKIRFSLGFWWGIIGAIRGLNVKAELKHCKVTILFSFCGTEPRT